VASRLKNVNEIEKNKYNPKKLEEQYPIDLSIFSRLKKILLEGFRIAIIIFIFNLFGLELIKELFIVTHYYLLITLGFTPQMVIDDQLWVVEFLKFTRGTDIFSKEFLEKAHLGYQRMLYIKWKESSNMEMVSILFTHAHIKFKLLIHF
jgi:hypothetical protein